MNSKKAYKQLLAAAAVSALLGTSTAWAADTDVTATGSATPQQVTTQKTKEQIKAEQRREADATERAAIAKARGTVVPPSDTVYVDNSKLATEDKSVLNVAKGAGVNLEMQRADGEKQEVTPVEAKYVSALTEEAIKPYIGKPITSITVDSGYKNLDPQFAERLTQKIGVALSTEGTQQDIGSLGNTGIVSEVRPSFTAVPEGVKLDYKLVLNPIVNQVQFSGVTVYPEKELIDYMGVQPNTILNSIQVEERVRGLQAAYERDGYMLARVTGITVNERGTLDVSVMEGVVEKITVHGNVKTKPYVITREMNQKEGKPFNKYLVRRSIEKVYNLGYFENVDVRILPGTSPDKVILEVDVLERKTGTITLGAGYSQSDGFVGIVELGEENFRGTGDKIKVHWEFGGSGGNRNYQISYMRPWIDDKGTSLGATVFDRQNTYTDYDENGNSVSQYDRRSKGFNLSLGRQTNEFTRDYVTVETRKDDWSLGDDASGLNYGSSEIQTDTAGVQHNFVSENYIGNNFGRTNSVTWQRVYDSRDNAFDPSRGKRYAFTTQWAGHGLGGDFDFVKVSAEARAYKPLGNNQVLAFRARVGWIFGDAAYSQLFTVGGSDTLRGYEDDQFRGRHVYNASLEYRFPIVKKVSGVVFTDIGDAWDAPNVTWYHGGSQFNASVGAGLRVTTPIGPVRLDYGVGRNGGKFHFSFGGQF